MSAEQGWMLLLFVAANFALAGVGSRLGLRGHGTAVWHASLKKPRGYPPEWIFAPIWVLIAIATGVGGWLIWQQTRGGAAETALVLYGFQLIVNAVWQGVAIGLRRLGLGMAVGVLLWGIITLTAISAALNPGGAWYWLIPYWVWVGFGVHLNRELWRLNPAPPAEAEEAEPPAMAS